MSLRRVCPPAGFCAPALALLLIACSSSPAQPLPTPSATAAPATAVPTWGPLSPESLRNGSYQLPMYRETVTLTEGVYLGPYGDGSLAVRLHEPIAFGDLNGDGFHDAAVLLSENGGGTGVFVSLFAMVNLAGRPHQAACALLDDRPILQGLLIEGGAVTVDAVIHGADEPMCCPEFAVSETFRLAGDSLRLVKFDSHAADGRRRTIRILLPAEGASAADTVRVIGAVSIAPFENSLVYRWLDLAGTRLAEGAVPVASESPGAAGSFDVEIPLPESAAPGGLSLQILDLSAVDGTMLAMDSVVLLPSARPAP